MQVLLRVLVIANRSTSEDYLAIARFTAPHGVHGDLRAEVLTDFPDRFEGTRQVYVGEEHRLMEVQRAVVERRRVLLKLGGVDTREAAQQLVGHYVYVPEAEAVHLPPGWYFWHQILGMRVQSTDGVELGSVAEVLQTGSNDVYVVRGQGKEILLPATQDVVRSIDVEQGLMTVELMEGLLE